MSTYHSSRITILLIRYGVTIKLIKMRKHDRIYIMQLKQRSYIYERLLMHSWKSNINQYDIIQTTMVHKE